MKPTSGKRGEILPWVRAAMPLIMAVILVFTYLSYRQTAKVFVGQNKPLIDVSPIGVKQVIAMIPIGTSRLQIKQVVTVCSVANYSGFDAHNIGVDVKYQESGEWIGEYDKANSEKKNKRGKDGVIPEEIYNTRTKILIEEIVSGDTKNRRVHSSGSLDLETNVCNKGKVGIPVWIRVSWENKKGHVFDEIHKYRLICTKDNQPPHARTGRAFTFIPYGIESKKDEMHQQSKL